MQRSLIIILILVVGLGLRTWRLSDSDITPDEHHYIHDAQRLSHMDPYISIRHHPFFHGQPNMGHPFLAQIATATIFKFFGSSIFTARFISVLSGMIVIGLLLNFKKMPWTTKMLAASIYAVVPLSVRFNRTAYLDSLLSLWTFLVGWAMWKYYQQKQSRWLIITGVASALAISTKLSGVFTILGAISLYWLIKRTSKTSLPWLNSGFLIIPTILISFLLNDPSAYINGITQPADFEFQVLDYQYWLQGISSFLTQLSKVSPFLLGPTLTVGIAWSLIYLIKHIRQDVTLKFLGIWLLGLLPFLWLQPRSEYAWLPILPVLSLVTAYAINKIKPAFKTSLSIGLLLFTLPFTVIYGLRFSKLPYIRKSHTYNRTLDDNFYQTVLEKVNLVTPFQGKALFLPQQEYPFFILRPDISWSYYGDPDNFDVYVTDPTVPIPPNFKLVDTLSGREDERELVRKIYVLP